MRKTMLMLALTCMSASSLPINPLVPPPDSTPSFEYGDDDLQSTTAYAQEFGAFELAVQYGAESLGFTECASPALLIDIAEVTNIEPLPYDVPDRPMPQRKRVRELMVAHSYKAILPITSIAPRVRRE